METIDDLIRISDIEIDGFGRPIINVSGLSLEEARDYIKLLVQEEQAFKEHFDTSIYILNIEGFKVNGMERVNTFNVVKDVEITRI